MPALVLLLFKVSHFLIRERAAGQWVQRRAGFSISKSEWHWALGSKVGVGCKVWGCGALGLGVYKGP